MGLFVNMEWLQVQKVGIVRCVMQEVHLVHEEASSVSIVEDERMSQPNKTSALISITRRPRGSKKKISPVDRRAEKWLFAVKTAVKNL